LAAGKVLAVKLRLDGVHDHPGRHVVDPEIILTPGAISQLGNSLLRIFHKPLFSRLQVNTGADHPVPGFEPFDIGELCHGRIMARLGPQIIHRAFPLVPADIDKFDEECFAVGILEAGQVLAIEGRLDGVHDHPGPHVVDPQVIVFVVTHGAHEFCGQVHFFGVIEIVAGVNLLDGFVGHIHDAFELTPVSGGDFLRIVGVVIMGLNDGVGAFDQVLEFTLFFVHHHGPGKCGLCGAALLERFHRQNRAAMPSRMIPDRETRMIFLPIFIGDLLQFQFSDKPDIALTLQ
jgi:hypothetical protein